MKKIVSFGDSFIFGTELITSINGSKAWPGLLAAQLGTEYETCARAGCGNESIAQQIYTYFSKNSKSNTVAVINWTWMMRWDFYIAHTDSWISLGPTCVPKKLYDLLNHGEAIYLIDFYKNYPEKAEKWNQYRSLQCIYAAQQFLKTNNIPVIQTYMDRAIWSKTNCGDRVEHYNAYKDLSWPTVTDQSDLDQLPEHIKEELDQDYNRIIVPEFIELLQDLTFEPMRSFKGQTFLEWSRSRGYEITPPPGDHPLEEAHENAVLLWQDLYQQFVNNLSP
jgi:hypothetical protein